MRIFITGGSGYLGARLSQYLSKKKHNVSILCHSSPPKNEQWLKLINEIIIGDITDNEIINRITSKKPEIIIHLVSLNQIDSENNRDAVDINVNPIFKLLKQSKSYNLKKFIYFSTIHSQSLKKNNKDLRLINNKMDVPDTIYGLTHLLSEKICLYFDDKLDTDCFILRIANSYGEPIFKDSNCWDLVINNLVKTAYLEKKIILKSDGKAERSFIHFLDVCKYVNKIITNKSKNKEKIRIVSSDIFYTILEIGILIKKVYKERYLINLPIFLNNFILLEKKDELAISNSKLKNRKYNEYINIKTRINELFSYLETDF